MRHDLSDAAAHLPTAAQFERFALELLVRAIGSDVAFVGLRGASLTSKGLPAELLEEASRPGNAYEEELRPVKRAALANHGVAVDTEVLGEARVRRTRYFRDFAAPLGGRHSLFGSLVLRGEVIGGLMLGRTGGSFRACEVERVAEILPELALARASYGLPGLARAPLPREGGPPRWPWGERVLARRTTGSTEIRVRDRDGYREMVARELPSSREMIWTRAGLEDGTRSGWPYVDLLHVAAGLARRRERALFLGCGGGVSPRQFARCYPGIVIEVVEPEATVLELARSFYGLEEIPRLTVHVAEGASFLEAAAPGSWDVIVVDAFEGANVGQRLGDRRFFRTLRSGLRPGGAFAFNAVGALDGTSPVEPVVRAAASEFEDVRVLPVMTASEDYDAGAERNVVIVGVR